MTARKRGEVRLFRVAGIDVLLHWSWLLIAAVEIQYRARQYQSLVWNVLEYLALFGIVLLHEFGHALACRQVGGRASRIVLWPLGGVAYVQPPLRPGAVLWSIAAGPLVNVLLLPVTLGLCVLGHSLGWSQLWPDAFHLLIMVTAANIGLLVFNLLPVFPLDGGQILHALLWFVIGRARSLLVVGTFGVAGAIVLLTCSVLFIDSDQPGLRIGLPVLAGYLLFRATLGLMLGRLLLRREKAPRHPEFACPACGEAPAAGPFWACHRCHARFDTFEHEATCPGCGIHFPATMCPDCHARHPIEAWQLVPAETDIAREEVPV